MAESAILNLIWKSDTSGATASISGLSKELQSQREEWKRQIYATKSVNAAAKVGILEQVAAEKQRSLTAKIGLAEQVLGEKQRVAALKNTESATLAVARAQANLDSLRSQKSLSGAIDNQRIQQAKGRASISQRQYELRVAEQKESPQGLSGLERLFAYAGGQNVGIATLREGANLFSNLLPQGIQQTGAIASRVLGQGGVIASGMSATAIAATGLTVALGVGGLIGILTAATSAVSYLGEALQKATNTQIEQVNASEPIVKKFQVSYAEADKYSRRVRERISELGRDLPVSAEEIDAISRGIVDNLVPGVKAAGKSLSDLEKYQTTIAARAAILAQGANLGTAGTAQANLLINKLSSGTSVNELRQIQIVQNSPSLLNALEDTFKKYGVKNSKDIAEAKLPDFIEEIMKGAVSDEQIKRQQNTVKATISSFMDKLFDPVSGLLGVEKDLDLSTEGVQSVFTSFSETISLLIGDQGLFTLIGKSFGLGNAEPLRLVKGAIDGTNNFIKGVNNLFSGAGLGDFGEAFKKGNIGKQLALVVNNGLEAIAQNPGIITRFAGDAGRAIGGFLGTVGGGLVSNIIGFATSLDYGKLARGLILGILDAAGAAVTLVVTGIVSAIGAAASSLISGLQERISGALSAIASIPDTIVDIVKKNAANVAYVTAGFIPGIGPIAQAALRSAGIVSLGTEAKPSFMGHIPAYPAASGFMPLIGAIASENRNKPSGSQLLIANTSEAVVPGPVWSEILGALSARPAASGFAPSSGRSLSIGQLIIQQQPGQDARSLAQQVIAELDLLLDVEQGFRLA